VAEKKTHQWPIVEITGGPHSKNVIVRVDDVRVPALTRAQVTFDVKDAVRIELHQLVDYATLRVEGVVHHIVRLKGVMDLPIELDETGGQTYGTLFEASGLTLVEALRNLVAVVGSPEETTGDDASDDR